MPAFASDYRYQKSDFKENVVLQLFFLDDARFFPTNFFFAKHVSTLNCNSKWSTQIFKQFFLSLRTGRLFVDPEFPPCDVSLFFDSGHTDQSIEWKRPGEICEDPR